MSLKIQPLQELNSLPDRKYVLTKKEPSGHAVRRQLEPIDVAYFSAARSTKKTALSLLCGIAVTGTLRSGPCGKGLIANHEINQLLCAGEEALSTLVGFTSLAWRLGRLSALVCGISASVSAGVPECSPTVLETRSLWANPT